MKRNLLALILLVGLWLIPCSLSLGQTGEVSLIQIGSDDNWTPSPFIPGYSLLEPNAQTVYGEDKTHDGRAYFPVLPVNGQIVLPVFLVDWSDFNPITDESNHSNPGSTFPGYVKKSADEISAYLNGPHGPGDYFREVSGGQLQVSFQVYPWMVSNQTTYLKNKEPNYYYFDSSSQVWGTNKTALAKDVLKTAISDFNINLAQFDADNNKVLDGFVLVYEGIPGQLSGTNLGWTNPAWVPGPPPTPYLNNIASLVGMADPNYFKFSNQPLLYNRYNNLPEQIPSGQFSSVEMWAHELGHQLLGYDDYYALGNYALSGTSSDPTPLHPAAMEKWMFAHWIEPTTISVDGSYILTNHHLRLGETYLPNKVYLNKILINGDPDHFLTIENRYFLPFSQGGSYFNEGEPGSTLESGLVIFEVNRHLINNTQIRRLLPPRAANQPATQKIGAFIPGDELLFIDGSFGVRIHNVTSPSEQVVFDVSFGIPPPNQAPVLNPIGNKSAVEGQSLSFMVFASDPDVGDTLTFSASGLPSGAVFDPTTTTFSWTPGYDQPGTYYVSFTVSDQSGLTDSEAIVITVSDVNFAPVITPIGNKTVDEGRLLTFTVLAQDADHDAVTLAASGLPSGSAFDSSTGVFSWKPSYSQSGSYSVTFFATDPQGLSDSNTITILVNDAYDLVSGLVGYWKFDEGQGTIASDFSGRDNTGMLKNMTTANWVPGQIAGGLDFDGLNDYVDMGNNLSLQLTSAMTVAVWIKHDSMSNSYFMAKQGDNKNAGWALFMDGSPITYGFQVAKNNKTTVTLKGPSTKGPSLGQWIHLTGVFRSGLALELYVNGVKVAEKITGIPISQYNSTLNFTVGRRSDGSFYTNGQMDEARIYNKALSPQEIQALYNLRNP